MTADPTLCSCCSEGQRPGMYDDGKPAACGVCSHLVSEHARVNRPVYPPSVAVDALERVLEGFGIPGAGTGALRAELAARAGGEFTQAALNTTGIEESA